MPVQNMKFHLRLLPKAKDFEDICTESDLYFYRSDLLINVIVLGAAFLEIQKLGFKWIAVNVAAGGNSEDLCTQNALEAIW